MKRTNSRCFFAVKDYDLDATLGSGQAFRWKMVDGGWEGIIGERWVRLEKAPGGLKAMTMVAVPNWLWLKTYLQIDEPFHEIIATFPQDKSMVSAVQGCYGLRLLKQPPWECLATFILSSTKQIVQIKQIVELLCHRFGTQIPGPIESGPYFSFPTAQILASTTEKKLRECKMGFRAPYLLETARAVANSQVVLDDLALMSLQQARETLLTLPGVGRKVADCVLLFAYGFPLAFPVDVWVLKAFKELYFKRKKFNMKRAIQFSEQYFGPYGGFAQQYLFHYQRIVVKARKANGNLL